MAISLSQADGRALAARISAWKSDPVAFVLEVFGPGYYADTGRELEVDKWQLRMLRALVRHAPHDDCDGRRHKRIAAKACKGPGKTAVLAWIGWWRLICCRHMKGYCCSITGANLKANLWTELSHWLRFSPLLQRLFTHKAERIESIDHPASWWLEARAFPQEADKGKQAESLAGLHGESVLVLLDEVGSFPQAVFDAASAIFNTEGQDALMVVAGNATSVDGPLYRVFTSDAQQWFLVEITGDPDDPERSSRIDIEVARNEIFLHGREDPVVMVNILGKFPPRGGNKLLGYEDVATAMARDYAKRDFVDHPIVWGLDVAAEGLDSSVRYKRQGPVAFKPRRWRGMPTDRLTDQVHLEYVEAKKKGEAPKKIFVDKGGVGRGTYDRLRALIGANVVIGVDFGELALDDTQFSNRRTEMWCLMSAWVREVGSLPEEPELRRDLTGPNIDTESNTSKGTRRILEKKKEMKRRGLPSPDDGDALALTFAAPVMLDTDDSVPSDRAITDFDPYKHLSGEA